MIRAIGVFRHSQQFIVYIVSTRTKNGLTTELTKTRSSAWVWQPSIYSVLQNLAIAGKTPIAIHKTLYFPLQGIQLHKSSAKHQQWPSRLLRRHQRKNSESHDPGMKELPNMLRKKY